MQADGVESYLENKGKEWLEQWIIKKGARALTPDQQKLEVVEALRKPLTQSAAFAAAIEGTYEEYLRVAGVACECLAAAAGAKLGSTFAIPRSFVQDFAMSMIERDISSWAEFNRLYDSELVRQAFFEEWRTASAQAVREQNPSPANPLSLLETISVVDIDDEEFWPERPAGTFYVHVNSAGTSNPALVAGQISSLKRKRGRMIDRDLQANLSSFEKIQQAIAKLGISSSLKYQIIHLRIDDISKYLTLWVA